MFLFMVIFQVSHHPPVSALHATHEKENIDVTWSQYFTPKFRGMFIRCSSRIVSAASE